MQLIKLNATDSTNAYLKRLLPDSSLTDFTVVMAEEQLKGKGQMGAVWESEAGKNLTISVLKNELHLVADDFFALNICVSLAVYDVLKAYQVPNLSIKWPNDILSGTSKICGILIENLLSGGQINTAVIGIGLNVNQTFFGNVENASSLKLILGKNFNLDELLHAIVESLKQNFLKIKVGPMVKLWQAYEEVLFRKDKPSTFENRNGELFMGFIRGISPKGKLVIALEDNIMQEFDIKEVKLLY
ncbi:biotin--[acetyl-CoA-carboxylase] ligase [Zobellia galactanivorans]|uniref:Biotin-[acetyl-CoA-carboxylase] ligase n=1 Tax=Zobellia galactanivorans (strain DSM 12802 / CCUG 47099 / CIP 106680 / NCIMB 13871 / Dsij) TaxID=63186 RepID=G0L9R1_ZOBGA|nr:MULTISPECIES: biotin--[acetyl-CoA-carboxylase] ligase [Zobellia]MBU3027327.1 biotin--[acetyl-CoA-carboxylase] ligase [Zobellia galactanivorans]MDO6809575.1 biotin--[acetyl-CoA-carboxylase] ligase [Zobellia galactanivorans]OWW23427.1 biotin--[acetyl-CoA-carboxylase] ligase [Zobellia sp. OII3]CAZ94757.1 Biotin-[acetyl-CoA-carboxylase] ligase [Zobellia galactanivorans]